MIPHFYTPDEEADRSKSAFRLFLSFSFIERFQLDDSDQRSFACIDGDGSTIWSGRIESRLRIDTSCLSGGRGGGRGGAHTRTYQYCIFRKRPVCSPLAIAIIALRRSVNKSQARVRESPSTRSINRRRDMNLIAFNREMRGKSLQGFKLDSTILAPARIAGSRFRRSARSQQRNAPAVRIGGRGSRSNRADTRDDGAVTPQRRKFPRLNGDWTNIHLVDARVSATDTDSRGPAVYFQTRPTHGLCLFSIALSRV